MRALCVACAATVVGCRERFPSPGTAGLRGAAAAGERPTALRPPERPAQRV